MCTTSSALYLDLISRNCGCKLTTIPIAIIGRKHLVWLPFPHSTIGIGEGRYIQAICVGTRFAEWEAGEDMFGLCEAVQIVK